VLGVTSGHRDGESGDPVIEAYPVSGVTDLLGRMPVRLAAGQGELLAYGFNGQRIAIPVAEIGAVKVYRGYGRGWGRSGPSLVVLDKANRVRLRARGTWDWRSARQLKSGTTTKWVNSDLFQLFHTLGAVRPEYLTSREARRQVPRWPKAPGFRRLRTRPRGYVTVRLALALVAVALCGAGVAIGVLLANLFPSAIGAVRNLIGIVLVAAAVWGALRLCGLGLRGLHWLAVSLHAGSPAPLNRFFGPDERRARQARTWLTLAMIAGIPLLIAFGPVIGLISLAHGFSDQALVGTLRARGVVTKGIVVNVPTYETDKDGNTQEIDHPTLAFYANRHLQEVPDPPIAGWTWPMNPNNLVAIVYVAGDPGTAAVEGQISGSPWHGAPIANVIAGGLLTVALVPLTWLTVRRVRAARRASREGWFAGFA
jgi:hypothetical protein